MCASAGVLERGGLVHVRGGKRPLLGIHEERELEALVLTIEFSATICVHLRCRFQQSHIVMESLSHSSTPYSLSYLAPFAPLYKPITSAAGVGITRIAELATLVLMRDYGAWHHR